MSSVYVSIRKESKWEPIIYSETVKNVLFDLTQRTFGIKDIRRSFESNTWCNDFDIYVSVLFDCKRKINDRASSLMDNVYSANAIFPTNLTELEMRRSYQDYALVDCNVMEKYLQQVVAKYNPNVNSFEQSIQAIDREIDLIFLISRNVTWLNYSRRCFVSP